MMATAEFGSLERIDPSQIWSSGREFEVWLAEHLDLLGEALEMEFSDVQREVKLGDYAVDILAEAVDIGKVVIECKLGPARMEHLGKLIAYAGAYDARVLILVTPSLGVESRAAVNWLNQSVRDGVEVWAVEFEVIRIGDSERAAHFRPVVRPDRFAETEALLPA